MLNLHILLFSYIYFIRLSNKINEINQIKSIFPQNQMKDVIIDRLKEFRQLQKDTKLDELDYEAKSRKNYNFNKI